MANEEHLIVLDQGVKFWNKWRKENPKTIPDLQGIVLTERNCNKINFSYTNLAKACLEGCQLKNVRFDYANLFSANFDGAVLTNTKFDHAQLLSTNFSGAKLIEASLISVEATLASFYNSDLTKSNFSKAVLIEADFYYAYLKQANFSEANLSKATVLGANFSEAILTGACIEDWNTNIDTNLNEVICNYIYLKHDYKCNNNELGLPIFETIYLERRPRTGDFNPREFATLYQKSLETVDLIFADGIDWKAFLLSFQELKDKYQNSNVAIQAIEKKSNEAFIIRLEMGTEIDKQIFERQAKFLYDNQLKVLEAQYQYELQAKNNEITIYRQQNTSLLEIVKLQATRPINVEAKTMIEQQKNVEVEMNFHAPVTGVTGTNKGTININVNEQQQTLAEASAEIQRLLKQLEETNPTATEPEQVAYVSVAAKPDLKQRTVSALKAASETAIDEFFLDNKYLKVGKAIVKGWLQASS